MYTLLTTVESTLFLQINYTSVILAFFVNKQQTYNYHLSTRLLQKIVKCNSLFFPRKKTDIVKAMSLAILNLFLN